jgi:hypothetical protein
MSSGVVAALIAAAATLLTFVLTQWLTRRWRGPTDREQWDKERTEWMAILSTRLERTEDALHRCQLDSLEKDRKIAALSARVFDLERRVGKAGELLHENVPEPGGG